ncbi:MAG: TIGR01777 family oxidoreductase, partial [Egibacteraceae bacterium]
MMRVAVTGASGLIGSEIVAVLRSGGHQAVRLVRRAPSAADEARWDPDAGTVDDLTGVDAVVHLAGEPVGGGRWTEDRKRRIRDSRVDGTRTLATALAGLEDGPRALICASGVHYYGSDRGDELLTEDSGPGSGFLPDVVRDWEAAADPARKAGIRVVHVRNGVVQSPKGGALALQLPLFKMGLGGRLGSGKQWVSWITLDDIAGIFVHAVLTPDLEGVLNGTAPEPVRNAEFTRVLARVLGRRALVPVPKLGPAVLLGPEGAQEIAFSSLRVIPARAEAAGYRFRHRTVEEGLRAVLS